MLVVSGHELQQHSALQGQMEVVSPDAKWQAFFASHQDWWDNRMNKRNPRGPDFKHKSTGAALWINSRDTPAWVLEDINKLPSF